MTTESSGPNVPARLADASTVGFTLIEMLVVLAIVALLLTIAVPRYFGSLARSKEVALQENLKVLRLTIDRFHADKGRYPEALGELVEQKYVRAIPVDPITESTVTWQIIPSADADVAGITDVRSGASGNGIDGRTYASY